jgi:hypothetical protein
LNYQFSAINKISLLVKASIELDEDIEHEAHVDYGLNVKGRALSFGPETDPEWDEN